MYEEDIKGVRDGVVGFRVCKGMDKGVDCLVVRVCVGIIDS